MLQTYLFPKKAKEERGGRYQRKTENFVIDKLQERKKKSYKTFEQRIYHVKDGLK